jgi:hypothetical protein
MMQRPMVTSWAASSSSNPSAGVTASAGISAYSASVPSGQSASTGAASGLEVSPISTCAGSSTFSGATKCEDSTTRWPGFRCQTSRPTTSTTPTPLVPIVKGPGGGL